MRLDRIKPHPVLDYLIDQYGLKNDAGLRKALGFDAPYISKIRSKKIVSSPALAVAIHEVFGLSFDQLRKLGGNEFVGIDAPTKTEEAL